MHPDSFSSVERLHDEWRRGRRVAGRGELGAIVGEYCVDLVGNCFDQMTQEIAGDPSRGSLVQFHEGKSACPVNGHEHVQLAFARAPFRNIDVKVADGIDLELLLRLVTVRLRQAGDAMALEQAMQRGTGQMRHRCLQG